MFKSPSEKSKRQNVMKKGLFCVRIGVIATFTIDVLFVWKIGIKKVGKKRLKLFIAVLNEIYVKYY